MVVYRHRRLDTYEVFYVGIGKTERRAYRKHSRNKHWHNIVNKADYSVEIIATPDTWEEACELEMLLISEYGRKDLGLGNLVNMTDGGDGSLGVICTEETRQKMSKSLIGNQRSLGKPRSEETKQKISATTKGRKGKPLSKETKKKLSDINKGKKHSYETKMKLSKLTEQQAYEIKYCNFNSTQEEIAFIYGVARSTVSDIRNNRSWKHI